MLINVKQIFTIFNIPCRRYLSTPEIFFSPLNIYSQVWFIGHILSPNQTNPTSDIHDGAKCLIKIIYLET